MKTPKTKIRTKKNDNNNNNNNQKLQILLLHFKNDNSYVICNHTHLLPNFLPPMQCSPRYRKDVVTATEATATKRDWQLQNSSPTATIDQENKTHQKKKTKVRAMPGKFFQALPRQIDTTVALIYRMVHFFAILWIFCRVYYIQMP
jgi:hypothetical protein